MKKTVLLLLSLVILIGAGTIFYNNYQKENSTNTPSDLVMDEQESPSASTENTEDSTINTLPAVDFTVYTKEETPVNLSDFYGKPIIVNFWATWCGPCKSELPAFEELYQEYGTDVQFMMVNLTDGAQETISGVSDFVTEKDYHFPVYFDTETDAALTYGVYSIPATLFIDADGNIVASHLGAMSESTLRNYIEHTLLSAE